MKYLSAMAAGAAALLFTGISFAQSGNMMNGTWSTWSTWSGGWMGGNGGMWMPILLVIVVVGLVVWIVKRKDK